MKLRYRRTIASLLVVSMTACAGPRQLAVGDRRSLPSQPRVYAVHHSPAAAFVVLGSPRLPQEMQAEDPAPRVKARLVGALKANLMLSNVRLVSDAPQGDEVSTLKSIFETGVVLDVRTMKWGLSDAGPHSFDSEGSITPGQRARAHYWGRARMINLEDSTVLWEATCSVQSSDRPGSFEAKLLEAADRCAAQFWPKALGRRHKPVSVSGHPTPAAGLPTAPRIVVDEKPAELTRLEITAEMRSRIEEQYESRVQAAEEAANQRMGQAAIGSVGKCLVLFPLCFAVAGTVESAKTAKVARPSLISEQDSARLIAGLSERATGASLAERISRWQESAPVSPETDAGASRLVVHLKLVRSEHMPMGPRTPISIIAQAQGFPATGTQWEATEHRYESLALAPASSDSKLIRQEIDHALDALAESISWTYQPKGFHGTRAGGGDAVGLTGRTDRREPAREQ